VDALRKRGGVPCRHLRSSTGGCGIYSERPRICRDYRCLWLQGGLEEDDRPDRLGAVLDLVNRAGVQHLAVREAEPGAFDASRRVREIAERYRSFMPVRITDCRDATDTDAPFRLLLPEGEERRVVGDRVTILRPGSEPEERTLPLGERVVRRLQNRWRARRQRDWPEP
jgi:hypothetical protein